MGNITNVFGVMASSYLREDKHWGSDLDFLKTSLDSATRAGDDDVTYLDVGCGPGFHLHAMRDFYPRAYILGIDPCDEMIEEAAEKARLRGLHVNLLRTGVMQFREETHDVVSCLNNTLGNLRERGLRPSVTRERAVRKMRTLVREGGPLIVSVYNLETLELKQDYGSNLRILKKSSVEAGDLYVQYRHAGGLTEYYSHWFTRAELIELLRHGGFKVELLEERMARLVVRARAV